MFLLALRNLRARTGRTLFTAFAIALGVALIFAGRIVGVATDEVNRQARVSRLAGADLEVSHSTRVNFSMRLMSELLAQPEVEATAPLLRARLADSDLTLLGVDVAQPLRPYELVAGAFFTSPTAEEILLPLGWAAQNGLGVGNTLPLTLLGQTRNYMVIGLLKEDGLPGGLPAAWLPIQTLQTALAAPDETTTILVKLQPNTPTASARESLQAALGTAYVVSSVETGVIDGDVVQQALTGAAIPFAGVVILLAGAFFIYNAFAITLAERTREIGQLRALGMTRGQVLRLTLTEALLVALAGSLVGLLLGFGLGAVIAQQAGAADVGVPLDGVLLAVGMGVGVTVGVVFNLARQAGRVSPLAALSATMGTSDTGRGSRWAGVGAVLCLILFGLAHWRMLNYWRDSTTAISWFTFFPPLILGGAVLFALPLFTRAALWLGGRMSARWSASTRLALHTLARQPGRAALTTVTLTISLMLVIFLAGITQGIAASFVENYASVFAGYDFALGRTTNSNEVGPPLSPALQADVDTLAAKTEMLRYGSIPVADPNSYPFGVASPSPVYVGDPAFFNHARVFRAVEGSWDEAARYFAAGPAIAIPEIAARVYHLHPGDKLPIDTPEGKVSFTVAVVSNAFILTAEDGARYFHVHPTLFFFRIPPGAEAEAVRAQARTIATTHKLQFLDDLDSFISSFLDTFLGSILALFGGLTSISGIVAALGIANTLIASVLERQRELGTLRALGFTRGQVRGLVVIEAGLLGFIGSLIGVLGGLAMGVAAQQLLNAQFTTAGFVPPSGLPLPWGMAAFALVAGPALSVLVALWPADRAASVNPADAMRAEGSTGFLKPAKHLGPTGLRGLVARLPLAAKLSFTTGLIIVVTIAALTALRVNYERQLIEDNIRAIFARATELMVDSSKSQLSADVTELTPAVVKVMSEQSGASADSLNQLFQGGNSPYDFTLRYAFITDDHYKVLSSSRAEYNNTTLTNTVSLAGSASSVRLTDWTGERAFEAVVAITNQGERQLGYAIIGLSTEPVDNITRDIVRGSVGMMAVALAGAILLTVFFTRRALAPLAQIAEASHAVARGDLSQRIPETRWDEVGRVARSFNEMVGGLNDRERMRDLFGRYLSREVSEAVLAGRVTFKGERKTITCLYVDMRGSTAFAEQHAPEEVMEALNQYFEVVVLAVEAHGGIVNRFVGDEAVCLFGAPTSLRDHADHALQAALSMREGLAYLNQKRTTLNLPTLKFGIGLNTGEVVAGATGSEERQEYTVIGDAMNLGARIQALNKEFPAHDILLSEFTHAALGPKADDYVLADLGPVEIRGKSQPVRVLGLVGSSP
ncbi:MAG: FtsX-like permease family protein [Chloroflexi bacterium]|nr:FtsX-like permease family protein [Chloroflexota bacterium]